MKSSTLRCSFGSIQRSGFQVPSVPSPEGSRQAILAARSSTSKRSILTAPLLPASMLDQLVPTSAPSGVTMPRPVTTTRLIEPPAAGKTRLPGSSCRLIRGWSGGRLGEELDRVADRQNRLGRIVGNLAAELFLEGHDQLDSVERVGAEVVDEARVLGHL